MTLSKEVLFFGKTVRLCCDGKCEKAWGINNRPRIHPPDSRSEDDYAFLADDELGEAPENPGTYEGGHGKDPRSLNKWCGRECERSDFFQIGEPVVTKDFSQRRWNYQDRGDDGVIRKKDHG